jgi:hypothetical protein
MNINRHNYEEFFLLYADKELSAEDRKSVENFVSQNEDLRVELDMLLKTVFNSGDAMVFADKDALLKPITEEGYINATNYEEFFVLYGDDELSNEEKAKVEAFVYRNPQYQQEFELLQQVKMIADTTIVFENKEILYRKEEKDDKVVAFRWWRMAAAAAVLLIAGLLWLMNNNSTKQDAVAEKESGSNKTINTVKVTENKKKDEQATITTPTVVNEIKNEELVVTKTNTPPYNNQKQPKIKNFDQDYLTTDKKSKETVEALVVQNQSQEKDDDIKATSVTGLNSSSIEQVEIKATVKANKTISIIDEPSVILNPDEKTVNGVSYAANETDNVNVLTSTVNKKNSLRGIIRKASRLIAKTTKGSNEEGKRRSILIGNFEIAAN